MNLSSFLDIPKKLDNSLEHIKSKNDPMSKLISVRLYRFFLVSSPFFFNSLGVHTVCLFCGTSGPFKDQFVCYLHYCGYGCFEELLTLYTLCFQWSIPLYIHSHLSSRLQQLQLYLYHFFFMMYFTVTHIHVWSYRATRKPLKSLTC